jgi:inorganic pyrophosphatase
MPYTDPYQFLNKKVTVKMDRPLGSKHPNWDFKYELNYGYIPDTNAPDGSEVDAYVLGVDKPLDEFVGTCIAVINRKNDDDDKLIVVPDGQTFTDEQIIKLTNFQEQYFKSKIIREVK